MSDKKQSAVARRLSQLGDTSITNNTTVTNQLLQNQVTTNSQNISSLNYNLSNLSQNTNLVNNLLNYNLDNSIPDSLAGRITELENNPQGGGGIDPSDPTQPVIIVDNFINVSNGDNGQGVSPYAYPTVSPTAFNNFNFTVSGATTSEADHLGILELEPAESNICGFALGPDADLPVLRFSDLNSTTIIIRTAGIKDTFFRFGLNNNVASDPPVDGVYFELLSTDTNFFAVTRDNNTQTRTDTGVAWVANTWYTLTITKGANNNPKFTINTTDITNTTNIPTEFLNLGISVLRSVTNSTTYDLDFFSVKIGDDPAVLPTGTTVEGTANEVEVTTLGSVITVGLPESITVPTINISQLNFNITPLTPTNTIGGLYWDTTYNTLSLGLTANTNLKIGQGLYKYVRNITGALIPKGKVVYVNGHHASTQLTIGLADASTELTSADVIGVTAEDIGHNQSGYVQTFGYLTGFPTNTAEIPPGQEGKALYLSSTTPGDMRIGLPTQPLHGVRVGFLVQRSGSGAMFVNVQNYQELEELSDVEITTITDGDILQWDNTELRWENRSLTTAGIAAASHTHTLSGLTPLNATTLVGRWAGAGSGVAQEVTIGSGLKLSAGGVLSTNNLQVVDTTTTITAGLGLTGGGDLTTNRTLAVDFAASGVSSATKAVRADDSRLVSDGNKGDINVSGSNTAWVVNALSIDTGKLGGDITTAGKALLDDVDAAAQRTTLSASRQQNQRFVEVFDDLISPLAWNNSVSGTGAARTTASAFSSAENTVGMVVCTTGTTTTGRASNYDGDESLWFGNGWTWMLETRACVDVLATVAEDYAVYLGFCDSNAIAGEPTDGAYFKYVRSVTNTFWVATTASNGVRTTTTTAVAPSNLIMQVFKINVNEAANSVEFRIDGTLVATHNTNIPTASARSTGIGQKIQKSAGTTARSLYVDYIHLQGSRTTDR